MDSNARGGRFKLDVQNLAPSTRIDLSRVGVTGLKRILRLKRDIRAGRGAHTMFFAEMDMFAYLGSERSGVHMSRFIENIEDIAAQVSSGVSPDIETLAERMAMTIARAQGTERSEVRIRAQFPMARRAPVSDSEVEDLYTFIGIAISDGNATKRAVGVEVNGFTSCPCAREMVSEYARETLIAAGYSDSQADEITSIVPLASHNQRGRGTLLIGAETPLRAEDLVALVERSMSSEIYELLKRPDELSVVLKGHSHPRFVEDVVREAIRGVVENLTALPDDALVFASQENFESIHTHNAYAERCGLLGDMRRELAGLAPSRSARVLSVESWLGSLL
ncbi:MAG: GTP cyclohydrolase MptA [Synergistaceae bacterium]|jgi:GTP cyclohydrolase-4|nr:GTP cyclohydrolase MptA [Synergistaceae bacterium]